ncbi:unnamed protein product [Musa acuminata subsp. malaccensis]|uniref:(wild Malaysian banana) hypothetical protein n=1 Tax=Musa acuminata subsp. malaccensis TaxID=214687 RepID=A0A804HZD3_MUSAM|nr:PREDICTED: uncharacterized protein LOC103970604 [Musa acuminata subsp. malaccensis]CAG1861126.1 unnamed protein product [Musa acuminata subsp. malaccensis]
MAKARRHAPDRLLGCTHEGHVAGADFPDLVEDEVFWSSDYGSAAGESSWRRSDFNRARPWAARREGGLSLAFEDGCMPRRSAASAASAPVEVPVWPKFLQAEPDAPVGLFDREVEEETRDGGWVPPHEYLAREKGRSVATSVLEGAGRTLKGRDMSRVRDAVWSRTGFFG